MKSPLASPLPIALLLALSGSLGACRSKAAAPAPKGVPAGAQAEPECICGAPEAALEVCLHPACLHERTNPNNPDCACGTLSLESD